MPRLRPVQEKPQVQATSPEVEDDELKSASPEPVEEPEIEIAEPEKPVAADGDADEALRKQIEEIRRSEELQRQQLMRDREEALRKAAKAEKKITKYERESFDQEDTALKAAIAAAKAEAEKAISDIRTAKTEGDIEAEIQATDRLTDAKANISVLRRGREELDIKRKEYKKELRRQEKAAERATQEQQPQLPPHVVEWLNAHPQFKNDPYENSRINYFFHESVREGYKPYSVEQIGRIEEMLGITGENKREQKTNERASIMSAPVSRDVPASGGSRPGTKITLTREEKEMARVSGITEVEYAKQKQRLAEAKANGTYGGQ